jgi:hypothetical protein
MPKERSGKVVINSKRAIEIARLDAEKIYSDLSRYDAWAGLVGECWHVHFELKDPRARGDVLNYVIDAQTGAIRTKKYEQ